VVLAGLLAVELWLFSGRESATVPSAPIRVEPSAIPPPPPVVAAAPTVTAAPAPAPSRDDTAHPHPITPERIRIQRENQLIGAMSDAMDLTDGATLRKLLNRYQDEYPEDPNDLQQGYKIIADCLEHPGPESTAAGQRYYDVERGSILRVFVGRHCLGQ
jgi:hypothetical protein